MIVVYPMLTSESVSPNVLPGIIKAVEKYILLYNADDVLKMAGLTDAGAVLSTGAKWVLGAAGAAGAATIAAKLNPKVSSAVGSAFDKISSKFSDGETIDVSGDMVLEDSPAKVMKLLQPPKEKEPKNLYQQSTSKPSLDIPSKGDAISLEPTWMTVTTKNKGVQILGVKVVPFRIKTAESILRMISQDSKLKSLDLLSQRYSRLFTRVMFRMMRRVKAPFVHGATISGDPMKDILLGKTQYGTNMFLCMSELDIENSDIFSKPGEIQKIQKLGWSSMIITDDVNRRATFCMKEFGGVCSVVQYNYMFASMGKDINKAYEDLEDLKKSSSPFFNKRTNRKQVFSEGMKTIDKYLRVLQN